MKSPRRNPLRPGRPTTTTSPGEPLHGRALACQHRKGVQPAAISSRGTAPEAGSRSPGGDFSIARNSRTCLKLIRCRWRDRGVRKGCNCCIPSGSLNLASGQGLSASVLPRGPETQVSAHRLIIAITRYFSFMALPGASRLRELDCRDQRRGEASFDLAFFLSPRARRSDLRFLFRTSQGRWPVIRRIPGLATDRDVRRTIRPLAPYR